MKKEIERITITPGQTSEGKSWTRTELLFTDGIKASTFNTEMIKDFNVGDLVEVSIENNRSGYSEIKTIDIYKKVNPMALDLVDLWIRSEYPDRDTIWEAYNYFNDKLGS